MSVQSNLELAKSRLGELIQPVDQALSELPAELNGEFERGYQLGKAEGSEPDADKIFTQQDLDDAVAAATGLKQLEVDQLTADKAAMQLVIDSIPSSIDEAKSQLKAELRAIYAEEQAAENEAEGRFMAALN